MLPVARELVKVVTDEAGALVVYCSKKYQGRTIELRIGGDGVKHEKLHAPVNARQIEDEIFYVAIFPRIYFNTYIFESPKVRSHNCTVTCSGPHNYAEVTLYLGIVTEIDWTND